MTSVDHDFRLIYLIALIVEALEVKKYLPRQARLTSWPENKNPDGITTTRAIRKISFKSCSYTLTLKSLNASFRLVLRSVLGFRLPIIRAQLTPKLPALKLLL